MTVSRDWIRALPKVELHAHLESMSDELAVELAGAHGREVPALTEPRGLDNLLRYLDEIAGLVQSRDDARTAARRFARRAHEQGVLYQEVIFNPWHWREHWHGRLVELVEGLHDGFAEAEADELARTRLTVSVLRPQSRDDAHAVLEQVAAARHPRVVAFSVDGNETAAGMTGGKFAPVFAKAKDAGLRIVVHTGESGGPDHVRDSLEHLLVERIDHGFRAAEDLDVVRDILRRGLTLSVCPSQNIAMGWHDSLDEHPMRQLHEAGVRLTINTDSPFKFELVDEYAACAEAFGWGKPVLRQLARNSITASFAPVAEKYAMLDRLDAFRD